MEGDDNIGLTNVDSKILTNLKASNPIASGENVRKRESFDTLLKPTMEGDDNIGLTDVDSKTSANLKASNPITSAENARQKESVDTLPKSTMDGDDNIGLTYVDSKMSANLKASNPTTSGENARQRQRQRKSIITLFKYLGPTMLNASDATGPDALGAAFMYCGAFDEVVDGMFEKLVDVSGIMDLIMGDASDVEIDSSVRAFQEKLSSYNKDKDKDMHVVDLFRYLGCDDCIYKVPEKLRKLNEEQYTPRVVSIGPIHYGKLQLQAMERYKWMCLNRFLSRTNSLGIKNIASIGLLLENPIRSFYRDLFDNIGPQEFMIMIMLDGIFIMELLMQKWSERSTGCSTVSGQTKKIFDYPWIEDEVRRDMMLHENQVPYMVLQYLFITYYSEEVEEGIHLPKLLVLYFDNLGISSTPSQNDEYRYRNLVDFLRKCHGPTTRTEFSTRRGKLEHIRSATELQEAGVTFTIVPETHLLDIEFTIAPETRLLDIEFTSRGVLKIPHLKVEEWTETFFRNLVAFEQCNRHEDQDMASYIILMSSIMRTPKDVDLLVSAGIIENVRNSDVLNLFSNLRKEIAVDNADFFYAKICDRLNTYSKDRWHHFKGSWFSWKRMLRRDYFSNPWSIISFIVAFILLSLTILQSVCSVISIT